MSDTIEVTGQVWGIFAHRFAIETDTGKMLVDLGPGGAREVAVAEGDRLTVRGTRKPSEIKAERVVAADGTAHAIAWLAKDGAAAGDPTAALNAVRGEGYAVAGLPVRKPKHWEILATRDGQDVVLHVELEGSIRKVKARTPAVSGRG